MTAHRPVNQRMRSAPALPPVTTALSEGEARRELARLVAEVARHDLLYYQLNSPEISDAGYDALCARLEAVEQRFPKLRKPDSPSRQVGAPPLAAFAKVRHEQPVLSLDNVFSKSAFRAFLARRRRVLGLAADETLDLVAEPKIDGLTAVCRYENGRFVRDGLTRGVVTLCIGGGRGIALALEVV